MECVIVYTEESLETMVKEGGCGHWEAKSARIQAAQYLICVRNRRAQWDATEIKPGTGFLIAKISRTFPSPRGKRVVIGFDEFAEIRIPGAWKALTNGQKYSVAYRKEEKVFEKLDLRPEDLVWQPFPGEVEDNAKEVKEDSESPFLEAKRLLATRLGIDISAIEITIRA